MLAALLPACATSPQPRPVIVSDGTESKQFEKLVMCGDAEAFTMALRNVGSHLAEAWDKVLGPDNKQQCEIRIRVDRSGHLLDREVISCDNRDALSKALRSADPIPVPQDECLLATINGASFKLNSSYKSK